VNEAVADAEVEISQEEAAQAGSECSQECDVGEALSHTTTSLTGRQRADLNTGKRRFFLALPESNKALVRWFYEEIDKGNIGILDELVAEDYIDHSPAPLPGLASGREGVKQAFRIFQQATPGYHRIENQIAEGDKIVTPLTSIGKHEGDLLGAPRTGNEMKVMSITIHRIANGKLVEKWSEKDMIGLLQQLGVMPPLGQPHA
jgi:predicted ester cyclase